MAQNRDDIKMEPGDRSGGINIARAEGEIKPPLENIKDITPVEETAGAKISGKIPIMSSVIKPPLRFEGLMLSELTGYNGWIWSEDDLEDIASLIQQCGVTLTPEIQLAIAMLTIHGVKFGGYIAWKRSGRPGDLKKKTPVSPAPEQKPDGSEDVEQ